MDSPEIAKENADILIAGILAILGLIVLISLFNSPDNYLLLLKNKVLVAVLLLIATAAFILMRVITKETRDNFRAQ